MVLAIYGHGNTIVGKKRTNDAPEGVQLAFSLHHSGNRVADYMTQIMETHVLQKRAASSAVCQLVLTLVEIANARSTSGLSSLR
jgi:hypothetical protein